ncbi:MAG: ABC transporter ATP-binding protein [Ruminococcaceae bacterium]|jgi:ABC-2 type transport system ATP-binding protein|nr:ABC transporter ATP-binding protein [Oscillospiraceae bacterium]
MIEIQDLVKTFDGFRALDGLTLHVPQGGIYGLVGPNGSGKSTVIRHITGIYRPDSGSVTVGGQPVYENVAVKRRIAYISDDVYAFLSASLKDMKEFYRGLYPQFDTQRYEQLREAFPLDERKAIRHLSKGMQKQAAFWLAMCCRPDYLVLDEPVDGLDPVMRRRVWGILMNDVAERGTTVLVSSHNLRELEDVCDHVGIIDRGRVLIERSLSELQDNIVKLQIAFEGEAPELSGLDVLHRSAAGRVQTLIVRGCQAEVEQVAASLRPLFYDLLPLTLEEIFIYELGGDDNDLKNAVL